MKLPPRQKRSTFEDTSTFEMRIIPKYYRESITEIECMRWYTTNNRNEEELYCNLKKKQENSMKAQS